MNEHPITLRDLVANLPPECRYEIEWLAIWLAAWHYAELRGWCDGVGSHEHRRLTGEAYLEGVPPSQTEMRFWIREHANKPPLPDTHLEKLDHENT